MSPIALLSLMFVPAASAVAVAAAPAKLARHIALVGTLFAIVVGLVALGDYDWSRPGAMQASGGFEWLPELGLRLSVGIDSIALLLIGLTLLLGPICVVASRTAITERVKTYYAWLLVLQAAMTGVFAARDLVLFYICFEFTLIPMFILISLYGSTNRKHAATKFFLYTFTGSIIALAGLLYVVWFNATKLLPTAFAGAGTWTLDIGVLTHAGASMSLSEQSWVLAAMMLGFGVKVPLFPVHTWLPLAHTEAPTAGSVILAGVLLKLGTYGIYRFVLPMTPAALVEHAHLIAVLAIIGIIYAGLICWVQRDVKKLVAYSSVSHLGFCVLGLVAVNGPGLSGSVLYMINHGLSTGALFLLIGMVYERYHTRDMDELGGLASKMPIWSTFMVFFVMASVGLPGLNGFVSEFLCLLGAFQSPSGLGREGLGATPGTLGPWFAGFAGTGMIVAAIYLLYMTGRVVFGQLKEPRGHHAGPLPTDLTVREIAVLSPIAVLCVLLGLYPKPVLDVVAEPVAAQAQWVWDHQPGATPAHAESHGVAAPNDEPPGEGE
ncbi:MAG: NADH-quinone oxidoreductase subunit M [Phycisphaeraceae bacterium]|nr:NADH-quinone oxidoreductase subunit M [Phycisphaeraceae bacterium]